MRPVLKLGSRLSPLALRQVKEIERLFSNVEFEVFTYNTPGDRDKVTPLSDVEGSDFFTKEIDEALIKREIDLAVHSSKDLPDILRGGLVVAYETKSISPFDALVSRDNRKFAELPSGGKIGVSSQRRKSQIRKSRPDLEIVDIRGTIEERLEFMETGKINALIVAQAALIRLGLENKIVEIFPLNIFSTHPKQGSLSLVAREEKWEKVRSILSEQGRVTGN